MDHIIPLARWEITQQSPPGMGFGLKARFVSLTPSLQALQALNKLYKQRLKTNQLLRFLFSCPPCPQFYKVITIQGF